ncbi:MAG: hypothetical protein KBC95_03845 [Candidatus Peribacteraceae bacterium]|nr:hypothetical protein [Candidatus Peribacteraceae bacterium]
MPASAGQPAKTATKSAPISAGMLVSEIIAVLPEAGPLLAEYGLHCFSCSHNDRETLAEGCLSHGFGDEEVAELVIELNTLLAERPPRPRSLTLTHDAALGLKEAIDAAGRPGSVLVVGLDENSTFCLEFAEATPANALVFGHREVPEVIVAALDTTLERIGGATIDRREGRFKLDLPEHAQAPACGCGGGRCSCADRTKK